MAKLVILTQGLSGRALELNVDRTTIGRVEDNSFQITEPSVSSHHCEVLLRGNEVVIKDLNSTNGSFINGEKIIESALKPGQTLRLGNVELKLEGGEAASPPGSASATAPASGPAKKQADATMVVPRGVSLSELESGGRAPGFDTSKEFSKKRNMAGTYFWLIAGCVMLLIVGLLIYLLSQVKNGGHQ